MRPILAFWILNILLKNFNLQLCELGLFYKHPKGKREYLINTDVNEGLRFLKIDIDFQTFSTYSLRTMFNTIEKCPYYNKTLYAIIDLGEMPKILKEQVAIPGYVKRVRRLYNEIESNYKFSHELITYDYVIAYKYGNVTKSNYTIKKAHEELVKSKLNSEIVLKEFQLKDVMTASDILRNFKIYIEGCKKIIYEQYVIHNDQRIVLKEFNTYLTKIKTPYS